MTPRLLAVLSAALLVTAPVQAADKNAERPDFPITFGGPFDLVDHQGQRRSERDFRGRFLLIQFGYTFCPDVCPLGLETITQALDLLDGTASKVQPLFISVDPARDTPDRLAAYVGHFHPALIGLTGSEAEVQAVARAYKVHRRKVVPEAAPEEYLVDHSSITYLMGPDGAFISLFPYGTAPERMADVLAGYLR